MSAEAPPVRPSEYVWVKAAERWASGQPLDAADSRVLVKWATSTAEARGTWRAVEDDLRDEAGLGEEDAEELAYQIRMLIHRLATEASP